MNVHKPQAPLPPTNPPSYRTGSFARLAVLGSTNEYLNFLGHLPLFTRLNGNLVLLPLTTNKTIQTPRSTRQSYGTITQIYVAGIVFLVVVTENCYYPHHKRDIIAYS